ncbi:hypothetical protein BLNAU_20765 [Blattamonas nauphoetae]|uniref:Uncharacterized protein n=1 Tax=Blattamonas nauphoetae TaxID=2049346 RepID=A0ABQ9X1Z6_9EUKA|nr:hypothetical protein BLNAU_20765 [Blattamonas nauphoetae]
MEESKKQGERELMTLKEEISEANRRDRESTRIIGKLIEVVRTGQDLSAIACIDSLLFFETEQMTNQLIGTLLDELPVSLKKGTAVQHLYKLVKKEEKERKERENMQNHLIQVQKAMETDFSGSTLYFLGRLIFSIGQSVGLTPHTMLTSLSHSEVKGEDGEASLSPIAATILSDLTSPTLLDLTGGVVFTAVCSKRFVCMKKTEKEMEEKKKGKEGNKEEKALVVLRRKRVPDWSDGQNPKTHWKAGRKDSSRVSLRTRKREEREDSKKKKDAKKELEANKLEASKTLNKDKRVTRKDRIENPVSNRCMLLKSLRSAMLQSCCQNTGGGHGLQIAHMQDT